MNSPARTTLPSQPPPLPPPIPNGLRSNGNRQATHLYILVGIAGIAFLLLVLLAITQQVASSPPSESERAGAQQQPTAVASPTAVRHAADDQPTEANAADTEQPDESLKAAKAKSRKDQPDPAGPQDAPPPESMKTATTPPDGAGSQRERGSAGFASDRRLNTGTVATSLAPGPGNPLIAPSRIASVVYVVDCSSSMLGEPFTRVAACLVDAVRRLESEQQYAVILFNEAAFPLGEGLLQHPNHDRINLLQRQLLLVTPDGGTDPTPAMELAIQLEPQSIVVLSDGEFPLFAVDQITELNHAGGSPIQINCLGLAPDIYTLRELAERNAAGFYIEAN